MPVKVNGKNVERIIKTDSSGQMTEISKIYRNNVVLWSKKSPDMSENPEKMANQVMYLINEERRILNRKVLYAVPHLNECAMTRAREQTESEGHWRPNGDYYSEIIDWDIMQYLTSAENIALGAQSPAEVIEMWRTSSNQWAIITNAEFTHIGAGVYYDKNKWYWVALFTNPAISRLEYPDQYLPTNQEEL